MSSNSTFALKNTYFRDVNTIVLGGIVDGILPINKDTSDILKDALAILSCKEIKLSSLKVRSIDDVAGDAQEMAAVVIETAKKTIITQVLKKNVIENIVPVVVSLKHMMEKERSPLLKELMMYIRELMKDYKNEVKEILSADRQLATEIEFDLRKFEEQQLEAARQRSAPASAQGTPIAGSGKSPVPATNLQFPAPNTGDIPGSVSSPRPVGSPKTPALKTTVMSPRPGKGGTGAPILRIAPNRNTPAREAPLSTLAVLNSARHMMTQPRTTGVSTEREECENDESPVPKGTPKPRSDRGHSRAISTPSAAMANITFHGEANMTFMPPSPISETSADQRMFDFDTSVGLDTDLPDKENVLDIKSPLAGDPKPRMWNVTSPAPKKAARFVDNTEGTESVLLARLSLGDQHNKNDTNKSDDNTENKIKNKESKEKERKKNRTKNDKLEDSRHKGNETDVKHGARRGKRQLKT